jgi:hypothetical protein
MSHLTNSREWAAFGEANSSSDGQEVAEIYGTQKSFTKFIRSYLKDMVVCETVASVVIMCSQESTTYLCPEAD